MECRRVRDVNVGMHAMKNSGSPAFPIIGALFVALGVWWISGRETAVGIAMVIVGLGFIGSFMWSKRTGSGQR